MCEKPPNSERPLVKSPHSNPYLTPEEAAIILHTTVNTLAKWRSQGKGSAWRDHGNIVYHIDDLHEWSRGQKRTVTRPKYDHLSTEKQEKSDDK